MKLISKIAMGVLLQCALTGAVVAADKGNRDEAVSLTKKAIAFYAANGKDKTFEEINSKPGRFVDRDLYVYVIDSSGLVHAHGANSKLIGKDLSLLKDADGKPFIVEIVTLVKANKAGWVDYQWVNPVTKQIEPKSTYVEPAGGMGFAVGVYR
ncbi:MAG: cache domain-containing protein [Pseudomonadota bacterium]